MIKKGQKVKILIGVDKNKTGTVLKVFVKEQKVLVDGINMKKKHIKAKSADKKGEIVSVATPIHISNVAEVK
jgi:large subunit ribosomal protein L24